MYKINSIFIVSTLLLSSCAMKNLDSEGSNKVVLASEVKFDKLNPARGDESPQAGNLWGDRTQEVATGFLFRPVDGFKSPEHIHNVSYRGIVIDGLIHNDDPQAKQMWMSTGAFWTQPAGHAHITAAKGFNTLAYIEIENGPYLVQPSEKAYDNGQRPVNIDSSNIVWQNAKDFAWNDFDEEKFKGVKIAYLWGDVEPLALRGNMLRLPAGFKTILTTNADSFNAVLIKGKLDYEDNSIIKTLDKGSMFASNEGFRHKISCKQETSCLLYIRSDAEFKLD